MDSLFFEKEEYLNSWMKNLLEKDSKEKLPEMDSWKRAFQNFKIILKESDFNLKMNCLLYLKKLLNKINYTDFEIKSYFNNILEELLLFLNDSNVIPF
jgi:hypothetical protein